MTPKKNKLPLRSAKGKPKIGLVLGGGGAKGCAYIGIYEIMIKNKIPIDIITGSSIGSIIGCMIANGNSPEEIKKVMLGIGERGVLPFKNFIFFKEGVYSPEAFISAITEYLPGNTLVENLNIPFGCLAVDLEHNKKIEFQSGPVETILSASGAIPFIFPPIYYQERFLVDSGILENAPALLARNMGAKKLIVINPHANILNQKISGIIFKKHLKATKTIFTKYLSKENSPLNIIQKIKNQKNDISFFLELMSEILSLASEETTEMFIKKAKPDLYLRPLTNIDIFDFSKKSVEKQIENGRKFAKQHLKQLLKIKNE